MNPIDEGSTIQRFSADELKDLSNFELIQLEDMILTENETQQKYRTRASAGRIVNFFLIAVLWGLFSLGAMAISIMVHKELQGIVASFGILVALGLAVVVAEKVWRGGTLWVRFWARNLIHYWPVTLLLLMAIYRLISNR